MKTPSSYRTFLKTSSANENPLLSLTSGTLIHRYFTIHWEVQTKFTGSLKEEQQNIQYTLSPGMTYNIDILD